MDILILLLVLGGAAYLWSKFSKISSRGKRRSNSIEQVAARPLLAVRQMPAPESFPYDTNEFRNERGRFAFPKYSVKRAWVRILDNTDYKAIWDNMDRKERLEYSIIDLEEEVRDNGLDLEVADLWEAIAGATKADLGEFGAICGSIEILKTVSDDYFGVSEPGDPESSDWPLLEVPARLSKLLLAIGAAVSVDFSRGDDVKDWLGDKQLPLLRDLAKQHGVRTSGTKGDLIERLVAEVPVKQLIGTTSCVRVTGGYMNLLDSLGGLYVDRIAAQVARWHPQYVQAVWEAAREVNEHAWCDFVVPKIAAQASAQR